MLEHYFLKPDTVDRIRASWLGESIERYVISADERGYAASYICSNVPVLRQFAAFAWARGARALEDLPEHVEPFVTDWISQRGKGRSAARSQQFANEIRAPVEQLLRLILPGFKGRGRQPRLTREPFLERAPGFFVYLREERGLRESSDVLYRHWLRELEAYLNRVGVKGLSELSPAILSAFVTESSQGLSKNTISGICSSVRGFLRYLHREKLIESNLVPAVEAPQKHRLSNLPRSISWDEVRQMLEAVDRRTAVGKRDFATARHLRSARARSRCPDTG